MATKPSFLSRRSARRSSSKAVVVIFETEDELQTLSATTTDLSNHGARVKLAQALLTPGQVLEFKTEEDAKTLRCRVVWTGDLASDQGMEAGLEFLLPPTE